MMQDQLMTLPEDALPLREALRRFVSDELWQAFEAVKAKLSKLPRRPIYLTTYMWGSEAEGANRTAKQVWSARDDVDRAWAAIKRSLVEQLIAGNLTAFAQSNPPFGPWQVIPAAAWRDLYIKDARHGHVVGPGVALNGVYIRAGGAPVTPVIRTGAPGQPTKSMHVIMDEWERRLKAGQIEPTRKAQAQVLLDWIKEAHPLLPRPAADTIYRRLPKGRWETSKKIKCVEK